MESPATAVSGSADEVLDPNRLEELRQLGMGGPMLTALMESFVNRAPALLAALGEAVGSGDRPAAERAAHELRGAGANLGARGVVALCAELEELSTAGGLDSGPGVFRRLTIEMELVDVALRAEMRLAG